LETRVIIYRDIRRHLISDVTCLETLLSYYNNNNTRALKATGTAFIQSFPTGLPEFWKPFSILHVFSPSLPP